jgi:hypothetical protein
MIKILKTVKLLFWGNLAIVVVALYLGVTAIIGITVAFCNALGEIWYNG